MTAYENITAVLDRIEKVSRKGLNYVIELEDIEQLQEAQQQVKNNDLLHSVSDSELLCDSMDIVIDEPISYCSKCCKYSNNSC